MTFDIVIQALALFHPVVEHEVLSHIFEKTFFALPGAPHTDEELSMLHPSSLIKFGMIESKISMDLKDRPVLSFSCGLR